MMSNASEQRSQKQKSKRKSRHALNDAFVAKFAGVTLFLIGAAWLFGLGAEGSLPWLVRMTGWTAPLVALSMTVVGLVVLLGKRAGYWSAEALVGIELVLIGLMAATFVTNGVLPDGLRPRAPQDGSMGGLIGWGVGSLVAALVGQGAAFLLFCGLIATGAVLLIAYTPLIYILMFALHIGQRLAAWWEQLVEEWENLPASQSPRPRRIAVPKMELPLSANFVPATSAGAVDSELLAEVSLPPVEVVAGSNGRGRAHGGAATSSTRTGRTSRSSARNSQPSNLPPLDLLSSDTGIYGNFDSRQMQQAIVDTLADFNVPVRVVHVESGPTVTQFGVEPLYHERSGQRRKVRVNRIVNLADDLALALAVPSIRIEAPVPGRPYVGIEVPNVEKVTVSLRGILESDEYQQKKGQLPLALGRDTAGAAVVMDLARAPHMLIAGATGAGKSVCINTIVMSLLMRHSPDTLRLIMVDPKRVELTGYNGIPHLLGPVITDVDQVMGALMWLLLQMDDRYRAFREVGARNIETYNRLVQEPARKNGKAAGDAHKPLPYIVLIIDEMADLMMTAEGNIEREICRLAQMARATGIHLILATQRPSIDVVTGIIKANFPTRIAFAVSSQTDSRVILDTVGAERLLGRGDMLLMRPDAAKLFRCQGCFVADEEIHAVTDFWKKALPNAMPAMPPWHGMGGKVDAEDELVQDAIELLRGMKTCSASLLQRRLGLGHPKAARLIDRLVEMGVVGPDLGGGQGRKVLLDEEGTQTLESAAHSPSV